MAISPRILPPQSRCRGARLHSPGVPVVPSAQPLVQPSSLMSSSQLTGPGRGVSWVRDTLRARPAQDVVHYRVRRDAPPPLSPPRVRSRRGHGVLRSAEQGAVPSAPRRRALNSATVYSLDRTWCTWVRSRAWSRGAVWLRICRKASKAVRQTSYSSFS